ncbi:hypothetical protein F4778DRAFT_43732 [Xylariomycetidae sp. FL2044]|nr:hypothetical protein F4778DRAFT_43732 [Xylariomycetidae sp. FL2044]
MSNINHLRETTADGRDNLATNERVDSPIINILGMETTESQFQALLKQTAEGGEETPDSTGISTEVTTEVPSSIGTISLPAQGNLNNFYNGQAGTLPLYHQGHNFEQHDPLPGHVQNVVPGLSHATPMDPDQGSLNNFHNARVITYFPSNYQQIYNQISTHHPHQPGFVQNVCSNLPYATPMGPNQGNSNNSQNAQASTHFPDNRQQSQNHYPLHRYHVPGLPHATLTAPNPPD